MEQIAGNEVEDDKIKRKFQSITRSKNISVNSPYDRVQPPLNVVVTEKAFHKKKNNRTDNDSEVKIIPSR